MLANWFHEPEDLAMQKVEEFEKAVKKSFVETPGQMKLLIVVDKLLTGFDAPSATYLYIDKQMQAKNPTASNRYPATVKSAAQKALYDNLDKNEPLALAVDKAVQNSRQDDWRGHTMKIKRVRFAIKAVLDSAAKETDILRGGGTESLWKEESEGYEAETGGGSDDLLDAILQLVISQHEY